MKTTILFRIKRVQQCKHIHAFLGLLPPFYARIKGISLLYSKEIKKYKFSSTANWTRPTGWYSLSLMPCSKFAWLLFLKQYHRNLRKQREYWAVGLSEEYSRNLFVVFCIKFSLQENPLRKTSMIPGFQQFNDWSLWCCDTKVSAIQPCWPSKFDKKACTTIYWTTHYCRV